MNKQIKQQATVRKPRRRERINSTKVLERRGQTWEKLVDTAGQLMAKEGPARVSVRQILLGTGISRGSFYGYCASKTDLLVAIIEPVFTEGCTAMTALLNEAPKAVIPGIVAMYADLWQRRRHALILIPGVDAATFSCMRNAHQAYTTAMKNALDYAVTGEQLRNRSATYTFRVLTRTAVPLLRVYQDHPEGERLYRESMLALLMG